MGVKDLGEPLTSTLVSDTNVDDIQTKANLKTLKNEILGTFLHVDGPELPRNSHLDNTFELFFQKASKLEANVKQDELTGAKAASNERERHREELDMSRIRTMNFSAIKKFDVPSRLSLVTSSLSKQELYEQCEENKYSLPNKSRNPVVEKILHNILPITNSVLFSSDLKNSLASAHLAQNWCAKCATSFRLTSDLVQHMRIQHSYSKSCRSSKRNLGINMNDSEVEDEEEEKYKAEEKEEDGIKPELDGLISDNSFESTEKRWRAPMKERRRPLLYRKESNSASARYLHAKRGIQSLECYVCGELFRERHHLTRHMMSHD
ncbi:unnamed protein product [Protopolystoma xenopodis]|uniref:C2H2-type domain-containing protein n=1 Tax=Protopolystoma xenopodis TaxID=117903 RepID=A0A3S5AEI8_9PLAT|nr:unnamed protein product [Protopolystoma xenopodis]